MGAFKIFAYVFNCSTAAIRYVSVVINAIFLLKSSVALAAIFAKVVVFPTPVGPTTLIYFFCSGVPPKNKSFRFLAKAGGLIVTYGLPF